MILVTCFILPFVAPAAEKTPKITGIFSDMRYHKESGDVLGTEIFIVFSNKGHFAVVQCAEGAPGAPASVPVTVKGAKIAFTLPDDRSGCSGDFQGTVSATGLKGRFKNESADVSLQRKQSYWQ